MNYRLQYSRAFITEFDDIVVPWKPLPIGEYLKYQLDLDNSLHSYALLENEIFCKCVLDKSLIRRIDFLKAGVITTVVQNILQASGEVTASQLSEDLDSARYLSTQHFAIIHELVNLVLDAFPYKPEEVYDMEYSLLLQRAALAEQKLLRAGVIKEPISIQQKGEGQREESLARPISRREQIRKQRLEELRNKQQIPTAPNQELLAPQEKKKGKWWKVSPVLESKQNKTVNTQIEAAEQSLMLTGHQKQDTGVQQILLQRRAQIIYKDLIEKWYKVDDNKKKE